jgi:integrase
LLLTGQRRAETSRMKWSDIEDGVWTIPASQSKSKREMRVPLSDMAWQVLNCLPRVSETHVWASATGRPITGFSYAVRWASRESGVTGWSLHDLRRTFRTGLARLKVDHFVAERALNHAVKGLTAVYNKYDYETEKREAFQRWADDLRITLDPPENVVRIRAEQG